LGTGAGTGGLTARTLGSSGGAETVTLELTQVPAHTHGVSVSNSTEGLHSHSGSYSLGSQAQTYYNGYNYQVINQMTPVNTGQAGSHTHTATVTESSRGGGMAHENMPPYYVLTYIIRFS